MFFFNCSLQAMLKVPLHPCLMFSHLSTSCTEHLTFTGETAEEPCIGVG